jgi:hypothetical protein
VLSQLAVRYDNRAADIDEQLRSAPNLNELYAGSSPNGWCALVWRAPHRLSHDLRNAFREAARSDVVKEVGRCDRTSPKRR